MKSKMIRLSVKKKKKTIRVDKDFLNRAQKAVTIKEKPW